MLDLSYGVDLTKIIFEIINYNKIYFQRTILKVLFWYKKCGFTTFNFLIKQLNYTINRLSSCNSLMVCDIIIIKYK